jgi:ATP-dependent RNA helicase RhlE
MTQNTESNFSRFTLPKSLHESLLAMGFNQPTPIQEKAIPVALEGRDVIGLAQTGTGKTAAFAIPLISHLIKNKESLALILVPTRELSNQVTEVLKALTLKNSEIRIVNLIGGSSMQHQTRQLKKGFRIVVATPGRLIDHLESTPGLLKKASIVVMDEADRMLDMGFAPQLRRIYPHLPQSRQMMLFSATFPKEIELLAKNLQKNPVKIEAGAISVPVAKIDQRAVFLNGDLKNDRLLDEINAREGSILVFVRTKRRTDKVTKYLKSYGLTVVALHGNKSQGQRNLAIKEFKEETSRILCATDIVARGIDISHVAHVINYDLPQVPEDYVHRIGRTGRNGRAGESISFISSDEHDQWRAIEKLLRAKNAMPSKIENLSGVNLNKPAPKARPQGNRRGDHSGSPTQKKNGNSRFKTESKSASFGKPEGSRTGPMPRHPKQKPMQVTFRSAR